MRKRVTVGLAGALLIPVVVLSAARVTIGTGPWSGVYFPLGVALANLLNKHIPGAGVVSVPVVGSAHALERVHTGELTVAIVGLATAHFGVRGQREFDRKYDNVGFVMAGMDAGQSLVTRASSGIKTFADVKGLRLAVNAPASRALLLDVLKLYGLKEADVHLQIMNFAGQIAALREETIDAGFLAASPRNADLANLAADQPIRILGLEPSQAKGFQTYADWTPVVIRARTYPGQDRDLVVPGTHTTLLAHKQTDPALIYRIVKTIIDHGKEFGNLHPGGREFTVEKTRSLVERNLVPIAFHPGAERYWREKGVLK
jgi:TRAP transporter TAXI family solute receptor